MFKLNMYLYRQLVYEECLYSRGHHLEHPLEHGDQPEAVAQLRVLHTHTHREAAVQYSTVQYSTMLVAVLALSGHLSLVTTHLAQSEERTGAQC